MRRKAAVVPLVLAATAALAQEREPPSPWKPLKGALAGAVGTCPPVDGEENAGLCYLVRCQGGKELVFVIRDPSLENFGVESVRLSTRGFDQTFVLDRAVQGEGAIALAGAPALLRALKSEIVTGMDLRTAKAGNSYVTQFELTRARRAIETIERTCR
jgi:hypothetical protein